MNKREMSLYGIFCVVAFALVTWVCIHTWGYEGLLLAGKTVAGVPRLVSVTRFAAVVMENHDRTVLVDDAQLDAVLLADDHHVSSPSFQRTPRRWQARQAW